MTIKDAEGPTDGIRTIAEMSQADWRMAHLTVHEGRGSFRRISQEDRFDAIEHHELNEAVPEAVRAHYDTARNLYLYAWHVYRFHVVAEHQVLASLELALRLALFGRGLVDDEGRRSSKGTAPPGAAAKKPRPLTLAPLLALARSEGLISNDRFSRRVQWAEVLADRRRSVEEIEFMQRNNITQMTVSTEPAVPTKEELEYDWLTAFVDGIPKLRNEYAHGTQMLHAGVLRTFEIACELINQLWPRAAQS